MVQEKNVLKLSVEAISGKESLPQQQIVPQQNKQKKMMSSVDQLPVCEEDDLEHKALHSELLDSADKCERETNKISYSPTESFSSDEAESEGSTVNLYSKGEQENISGRCVLEGKVEPKSKKVMFEVDTAVVDPPPHPPTYHKNGFNPREGSPHKIYRDQTNLGFGPLPLAKEGTLKER